MKAIVKYKAGFGNIEMRDIPEPSPGPGEVKIKIKAASICGSDLHIYKWDIGIPTKVPFVVGHEFSGTVSEIGENVTGLSPGDRVTAENSRYVCGTCTCCMTGNYNLCRERKATGYAFDGGFAEYCVVPCERVHKLPDNVDFVTASLSDPSACVYHAVQELTGVNAGDLVLITGAGAMGLFSVQYVRSNGGIPVITGLAKDKRRLEVAASLGAERTVNVSEETPEEVINELSNGLGADIVVECSGNGSAANSALKLLRPKGKYVQVGIFGKPVEFDLDTVLYREVQIKGSFSQKYTSWKEAIKLFSQGRIAAKPLVTDILSLDEWETGFRKMFNGDAIKVVFSIGE